VPSAGKAKAAVIETAVDHVIPHPAGVEIWIADHVRVIGIRAYQGAIRSGRDIKRIASLQVNDAVRFPAAEDLADDAVVPFERRQIPDIGRHETVLYIEVRNTAT
jgi:hypothetical protein